MRKKVVRLLAMPADTIMGQGLKGTFRGWLSNSGELKVETPFTLDAVTALKVLMTFERFAQDDGISVMGCEFIHPKNDNRLINGRRL
jgi:hypothetical protein